MLLSGGQWQRLALARAFLRDRRDLMILDEPSSGLDAEAEHEVHSSLRHHRAGATSVLISHRLGAVRDANLIAVLAEGKVAELGTHDELMPPPASTPGCSACRHRATTRWCPSEQVFVSRTGTPTPRRRPSRHCCLSRRRPSRRCCLSRRRPSRRCCLSRKCPSRRCCLSRKCPSRRSPSRRCPSRHGGSRSAWRNTCRAGAGRGASGPMPRRCPSRGRAPSRRPSQRAWSAAHASRRRPCLRDAQRPKSAPRDRTYRRESAPRGMVAVAKVFLAVQTFGLARWCPMSRVSGREVVFG